MLSSTLNAENYYRIRLSTYSSYNPRDHPVYILNFRQSSTTHVQSITLLTLTNADTPTCHFITSSCSIYDVDWNMTPGNAVTFSSLPRRIFCLHSLVTSCWFN